MLSSHRMAWTRQVLGTTPLCCIPNVPNRQPAPGETDRLTQPVHRSLIRLERTFTIPQPGVILEMLDLTLDNGDPWASEFYWLKRI